MALDTQVSIQELQRLNDAILFTMDCIRRVTPQLVHLQGQTMQQTMHGMIPWQPMWQMATPAPWHMSTSWQSVPPGYGMYMTTPPAATPFTPVPPTVSSFMPQVPTSPVLNLQRPF